MCGVHGIRLQGTHTHTRTHAKHTHTSKWEPAGWWCCVEAAETQWRACSQTKRPRKRIQTLTLTLSGEHLYHSAIYKEAPVGSSEQKVRLQKTDSDHRDGESDAERREIIKTIIMEGEKMRINNKSRRLSPARSASRDNSVPARSHRQTASSVCSLSGGRKKASCFVAWC